MTWVIRSGLVTATVLIASGLIAALATGDTSLEGVTIRAAFTDAPFDERLIVMGILALVATPVMEVLGLIVVWVLQKDWRFVVVGLAVVAVLSLAFSVG